jgi:hypothetical protein
MENHPFMLMHYHIYLKKQQHWDFAASRVKLSMSLTESPTGTFQCHGPIIMHLSHPKDPVSPELSGEPHITL